MEGLRVLVELHDDVILRLHAHPYRQVQPAMGCADGAQRRPSRPVSKLLSKNKRDWSAHHLGDFEPKARHWVKVMHDVCAVLHRLFHLALRRNATRGATLQHSAARRRIVASKSGACLPR